MLELGTAGAKLLGLSARLELLEQIPRKTSASANSRANKVTHSLKAAALLLTVPLAPGAWHKSCAKESLCICLRQVLKQPGRKCDQCKGTKPEFLFSEVPKGEVLQQHQCRLQCCPCHWGECRLILSVSQNMEVSCPQG